MATRGAVNEIVSGLVYQRGQVFTWPLEQKKKLIEAYNIKWVINFWPKIDSDMSLVQTNYLFVPLPDSKMVIEPYVVSIAEFLATRAEPVLVLCEAGKTRSVCFSAFMARLIMNMTGKEALGYIKMKVPSEALKWEMEKFLERMDRPRENMVTILSMAEMKEGTWT